MTEKTILSFTSERTLTTGRTFVETMNQCLVQSNKPCYFTLVGFFSVRYRFNNLILLNHVVCRLNTQA